VSDDDQAAGAGPAVWGRDEDQCRTLARIAEVVRRRRLGVDYTLAGMDSAAAPGRVERAGPGPAARRRAAPGPARHHPGGEGDRRQQQARLAGGAHLRQAGAAARLIYRVHRGRRGKYQRKGFTETDYARLLNAAHQQLGGPLVVIWDYLNSHVSQAITELMAARDWLTVYQLPPYAHELNPVELVWSHLKHFLANMAKRNLSQLTALVRTRLKRSYADEP
jgi:putative transposase